MEFKKINLDTYMDIIYYLHRWNDFDIPQEIFDALREHIKNDMDEVPDPKYLYDNLRANGEFYEKALLDDYSLWRYRKEGAIETENFVIVRWGYER